MADVAASGATKPRFILLLAFVASLLLFGAGMGLMGANQIDIGKASPAPTAERTAQVCRARHCVWMTPLAAFGLNAGVGMIWLGGAGMAGALVLNGLSRRRALS